MASFDYEKFRQLPLPTERQITANWQRPFGPPVVSVVCLTYNQEAYIEDAIRGFLTQETEFPFEVIIHDDASTDGTQAVVRGYQRRYPSLIKAIFQKENQYSKGTIKVGRIAAGAASGKYIALCEGDDFWIDKRKLSIQVQALRANPKHKICFHRCVVLSGNDSLKEKFRDFLLYPRRPAVVSAKVMVVGEGGYVPTASIMLDRLFYISFPEWYDDCPVGDYFVQVLCSHPMGAIFVPQRMCFYRTFANGSWSSGRRKVSVGERINFIVRMKLSFEALDRNLNNDFSVELRDVQDLSVLYIMRKGGCSHGEIRELFDLCSESKSKRILLFFLGSGRGDSGVFRCALVFLYVMKKARQHLNIFASHYVGS